ncbi:MAG TPA: DUF3142 domain-containing protein [Pyrinomonadaceae bacterium]|nr:DUF3142 domain-containing protein [Pyrinomonadaceae bacterium]
MNKKLWLLPLIVLLPITMFALRPRPKPQQPKYWSDLPPVIIWAWERPEKLDFIDTNRVGVAFLAKTLRLQGDRVFARPRYQPLELAPGTKLMAVIRIETDRPTLSSTQLEKTAAEITKLSAISAVQIDFDATVSEREFYKGLLNELRRRLPPSTSLSITALASWCAGDNWLDDLPIDEAVPMLFRMGVDRGLRRFDSAICRNSAGVAIDEPLTPPAVDRLYIFNPNSWSQDSLNTALESYHK